MTVRQTTRVVLEVSPRKAFATAVDWPGWSRSGKTPEGAIEALRTYAARYAPVAEAAGLAFGRTEDPAFDVVATDEGGAGTEFGVPGRIGVTEHEPLDAAQAARRSSLVAAAWQVLEVTAAAAPAELRKGPRGGGRDTAKIVAHVIEAEHAYAREMGIRVPPPRDDADVRAMRAAIIEVLRAPSDGTPFADRRWTTRYAAQRIAWHALDHAWEIEDRSEPEHGSTRGAR